MALTHSLQTNRVVPIVVGYIKMHDCGRCAAVFTTDHQPPLCLRVRHRIPKEEWWLSLRTLMRIMAQHDAIYEAEVVTDTTADR